LWKKPFLLVILLNFLLFFSMYSLMTTLPIYVLQLGGGNTAAGLTIGVFSVSAVLARPYFGQLMDSLGRKTVLAAGALIFLLTTVAYIWIDAVWMLLILRSLQGVGWAACTNATWTIATDVIPSNRMSEGMGYHGASSTIAMSLGPALALQMIEGYSFSLLFVTAIVFSLAVLITSVPINYEGVHGAKGRKSQAADNDQSQTRSAKASIIEKTAIAPSLVLLCSGVTYGGIISFIPAYAAFRGVSNVGLFFTVYALVLLISRPFVGRWADKNGPGPVIILGISLLVVSQVMLLAATNLVWFLAAGLIYALGFGAVQPILNAVTVSLAPPERRGAANATFLTAWDLGIAFGSVTLGVISQQFGFVVMWGAAGSFSILALIVYFAVLSKKIPIKK
jgi:MFS family permease